MLFNIITLFKQGYRMETLFTLKISQSYTHKKKHDESKFILLKLFIIEIFYNTNVWTVSACVGRGS